MKTSPNIGLSYPDSDNDPFDELTFTTVFDALDAAFAPMVYGTFAGQIVLPPAGAVVVSAAGVVPARPLWVRFQANYLQAVAPNVVQLFLWDDTANVNLGVLANAELNGGGIGAGAILETPCSAMMRITPPAAGNRTYTVRGTGAGGTNSVVGPGFLSVGYV